MSAGLEKLEGMEYPGRFIVLGKNVAGEVVVVQGITVRTPKYQQRKHLLEEVPYSVIKDHYQVRVVNTDPKLENDPQANNLLYNAMFIGPYGVTVGNGKQTTFIIDEFLRRDTPLDALTEVHSRFSYEDDHPTSTPRISGATDGKIAYMGIIKKAEDGSPMRHFFHVPLINGRGFLLPTYQGTNSSPPVSFAGEPFPIEIYTRTAFETARHIYDSIGLCGGNDIRVAVSALHCYKEDGIFNINRDLHTINRHGLEGLN